MRLVRFDEHRAVVAVIAHLAPGHRRAECVNGRATQPIDKIWEAIKHDALVFVIVPGHHGIRAPGLVWPLHDGRRAVVRS